MNEKHSDREFESELHSLKETLKNMDSIVHDMGTSSLKALFEGNLNSAYEVVEKDDEVDRLELDIDRQCVNVIARRQPLGEDLRLIVSVQKTATDLERIADLFVCIAERAVEIRQSTNILTDETDLRQMIENVLNNISEAVSAFLASDEEKASHIILKDRQIDAFYSQLFRALMEKMRDGSSNFSIASRIMTIISCAERIGDHTKNICEHTSYLATGRIVTHRHYSREENLHPIRCIVFLCVQNSARSQMAEGLAKNIFAGKIDVFSAGSAPSANINPTAIEVMKEIGIDISKQHPKRLTDIPFGKVDLLITLCSEEICIELPSAVRRMTWLFEDPALIQNEEEKIKAFRHIRDELKIKIESLYKSIYADKT